MKFRLEKVREAPEGFGTDALALVDFVLYPGEEVGSVKLTRWSKAKEKSYDAAVIVGARSILVYDAVVRRGKSGAWLQANGWELPRDVSQGIAEAAELTLAASDRVNPADGASDPRKTHVPPARPMGGGL